MLELFSTVLIWGLSFALTKKALNLFSPFELVTFRLALGGATAALLVLIFSGAKKGAALSFKKTWSMALALGFFEFAGTYILYTWSLSFLPSGVVGTLTLMTPTLTFLVGYFLKVHPATLKNFAATLLSILGACLCFPILKIFSNVDINHDAVFGFSLLMLSNLAFAVGNVLITKWDSRGEWRQTHTVKGLICGALLAALVTSLTKHSPATNFTHLNAWFLPLYLGVIATGLGFWLWNRGVQKISA